MGPVLNCFFKPCISNCSQDKNKKKEDKKNKKKDKNQEDPYNDSDDEENDDSYKHNENDYNNESYFEKGKISYLTLTTSWRCWTAYTSV